MHALIVYYFCFLQQYADDSIYAEGGDLYMDPNQFQPKVRILQYPELKSICRRGLIREKLYSFLIVNIKHFETYN